MSIDPYKEGLIKEKPLVERSIISGKIVAVGRLKLEKRGLKLIHIPSRALLKNEIHELITTAEDASLGGVVNSTAVIGFFSIEDGGIVYVGDNLAIGGKKIGVVVGYDETHMPNHYNIVIRMEKKKTGLELGLKPGDHVTISEK